MSEAEAPLAHATSPPPLRLIIPLVAVAGALGALARVGLGELVPEQAMKFPWTTLAVNASGSLVLGLLFGMASVRPNTPRWLVPTLGTGFLSAYTTFSTVIIGVMPSFPGGAFDELTGLTYLSPGAAEMAAYLVISVLGCTAAAAAGMVMGRSILGGTAA